MDSENVPPSRASGLRPPTKSLLPSMSHDRNLCEATDSEINSRGAIMHATEGERKHRPAGLPEPIAKRKTLAERAGEPNGSEATQLSNGLPISSLSKSASLAGSRYASSNSSASSHMASSFSSRQPSSSSTTGRAAYGRPQSSFGHSRSKSSITTSRPATAFDASVTEDKISGTRKRQGMLPTPCDSSALPIVVRRQRLRKDQTGNVYITRLPSGPSSGVVSADVYESACPPSRDVSISTYMQNLSLDSSSQSSVEVERPLAALSEAPKTPSYIPKLIHPSPSLVSLPSVPCKRQIQPAPRKLPFMSKDSNMRAAWDTKGRIDDIEALFGTLREQVNTTTQESSVMQNNMQLYRTRINELEAANSQLSVRNSMQQSVLDETKAKLANANLDLETCKRNQISEMQEVRRQCRGEIEDMRDQYRRKADQACREAEDHNHCLIKAHREEITDLDRKSRTELADEREKRMREIQELSSQLALQKQNLEVENSGWDKEKEMLQSQLRQINADIQQERTLNERLSKNMGEANARVVDLEATIETIRAKASFLESDSQAQSQAFADLRQRTQEAIESAEQAYAKLRAEETLRRKLHNQVQELKGNIRVFCRVRPILKADLDETSKMDFPDTGEDCKELAVQGPESKTALGKITRSKNNFTFDRVFAPSSSNGEIFEEISQLVQSALDGYNVCIFCYGQTGSGKTYTMSSSDGMIPLAVQQIYRTAAGLAEKGWVYSMEGSFVEVYNETLNDLLGKAEDIDKKKLHIIHDGTKTSITDVTTELLESAETVTQLLKRAAANRSVAATKANARSSRSHSVFILKLMGNNTITGEQSEGTLNLVDLAGSERLAHSQAEGDRLKETQSINKSLSCLGDVIGALGQGKEGGHIPYRNSKLTYLLQNSLGGNSKTLMFVMISPLKEHLGETLTSLKFATKVHNTHIGTAKRQTRTKD